MGNEIVDTMKSLNNIEITIEIEDHNIRLI